MNQGRSESNLSSALTYIERITILLSKSNRPVCNGFPARNREVTIRVIFHHLCSYLKWHISNTCFLLQVEQTYIFGYSKWSTFLKFLGKKWSKGNRNQLVWSRKHQFKQIIPMILKHKITNLSNIFFVAGGTNIHLW